MDVREGSEVATILEVARTVAPTLVVLGMRSRGGSMSLATGSATDAVAHRSPQTMLLVKR